MQPLACTVAAATAVGVAAVAAGATSSVSARALAAATELIDLMRCMCNPSFRCLMDKLEASIKTLLIWVFAPHAFRVVVASACASGLAEAVAGGFVPCLAGGPLGPDVPRTCPQCLAGKCVRPLFVLAGRSPGSVQVLKAPALLPGRTCWEAALCARYCAGSFSCVRSVCFTVEPVASALCDHHAPDFHRLVVARPTV